MRMIKMVGKAKLKGYLKYKYEKIEGADGLRMNFYRGRDEIGTSSKKKKRMVINKKGKVLGKMVKHFGKKIKLGRGFKVRKKMIGRIHFHKKSKKRGSMVTGK
jgi:hypothetical protein